MAVVVAELEEVKAAYGDERRTEIIDIDADIDVEDMIAPEEMVVTVTHGGYVKRNPKIALQGAAARRPRHHRRRDARGGLRRAAVRRVDARHAADVHQQGARLLQEGLGGPAGGPHRQGQGVRQPDPAAGGRARGGAPARARVLRGGVRRHGDPRGPHQEDLAEAFANIRSSGIIALSIPDDDDLVARAHHRGRRRTSCSARATAGPSASARRTCARWGAPRAACAASACARADDQVVGMAVIPREEPATLLTVCERGYGKRTPTSDYPTKNRGGKGVITIKTTERNGKVVGLRLVTDDDDLMLITDGGKLIRMPVDGIPTIGRNTQGVRLIRLEADEKVVAMERMAEKEEGERARGRRPRSPPRAPSSRPSRWPRRIWARRPPADDEDGRGRGRRRGRTADDDEAAGAADGSTDSSHGRRTPAPSARAPRRCSSARSALFPGGVNSPVRAFKAVGGDAGLHPARRRRRTSTTSTATATSTSSARGGR